MISNYDKLWTATPRGVSELILYDYYLSRLQYEISR